MEHVSTLCALSTVGVAPTGFAFGRVDCELSKLGRLRRRIFHHDQCTPVPDSSFSPRTGPVQTEPSQSVATGGYGPLPDGAATPNEPPSEATKSRRKSSFAGTILRRRGQTLSNPSPLRLPLDTPAMSRSRRPSSSWVRRLSFQPESRWSSQSPVSPSFGRSTSPPTLRPLSQRRAPNRLVKRSPSQPSDYHPPFAQPPPSPSTSFMLRRPATSYQRSERLGHKPSYSLSFEPRLGTGSSVGIPPIETRPDLNAWSPYLFSSAEGVSEGVARKFSTATNPKEGGLRRICPSRSSFPVLVVATSVAHLEPIVDRSEEEHTPTSPVHFRNPFKPTDNLAQDAMSAPRPEYGDCLKEAPKTPATDLSPMDSPISSKLPLVRTKRRAMSTPVPRLSNLEGTALASYLSLEKRIVTDPTHKRVAGNHTILTKGMKSGTAPLRNEVGQLPDSTHARDFVSLAAGKVMSRPQVVPSYSRTETENERETYQRPFSADVAAGYSSLGSIRQHPKRHSIAASDPASTIISSEDTRIFSSGDEDETDFLSDTAFDSIRTHFTANSSVDYHVPRIDAIFDKDCALGFAGEGLAPQTRVRFDSETGQNSLSAIGVCEMTAQKEDNKLSFLPDLTDEEDARSLVAGLPDETYGHLSATGRRKQLSQSNGKYVARGLLVVPQKPHIPLKLGDSDSHNFTSETYDPCPKTNIFDWSEQSKNDRETSVGDGRPRTVHGKHGSGPRGSRATGRKAPSTLHLRSQSVPVSRDNTINIESRQSSGKFGTWGLGSKGVSEDWDSDFEFEDADESTFSESIRPSKAVLRRGMIVPQSIMERQASLHGQFGQVQELTLLVEELKRLRHQASFLGIARKSSDDLWKEAEGIVNLATLDEEDNDQTPPGSPSSLTFSFDDSEGESSNLNDPGQRGSGDSWQRPFSRPVNTSSTIPGLGMKEEFSNPHSVLDLIYQQRLSHDPTSLHPHLPKSKKLPFDTQSLHDLVVRAGAVTRALKDVIRKAEGVATDPDENRRNLNPPFSRIFEQPSTNDSLPAPQARCIA